MHICTIAPYERAAITERGASTSLARASELASMRRKNSVLAATLSRGAVARLEATTGQPHGDYWATTGRPLGGPRCRRVAAHSNTAISEQAARHRFRRGARGRHDEAPPAPPYSARIPVQGRYSFHCFGT